MAAEKDALTRRIFAARLKDGYTGLCTFLLSGVSVGIDPSGCSRASEEPPLDGQREHSVASGAALPYPPPL